MIHVTCRLTAKYHDQLRDPTLGNRVWATFSFLTEDGDYYTTDFDRSLSPCLRAMSSSIFLAQSQYCPRVKIEVHRDVATSATKAETKRRGGRIDAV